MIAEDEVVVVEVEASAQEVHAEVALDEVSRLESSPDVPRFFSLDEIMEISGAPHLLWETSD